MKTKILHITECMGGGVETAIAKYINESDLENTQHFVCIISGRNNDSNGQIEQSNAKKIIRCDTRAFLTPIKLYQLYKEMDIDYVHLHSSFAGFFGRIGFIPRKKIIYTPHCFSFLIAAKSAVERFIYRVVEEILTVRTGAFAPCGAHEAELCRRFLYTPKVIELNNSVSLDNNTHQKRIAKRPLIVMAGRACPQKGVDYFINVAKLLAESGSSFDFMWIGGGSPIEEDNLRKQGVFVTGWLEKNEAVSKLRKADIYLHSAAWEGNPVSLIEAAFLDLPTFARKIDSTKVFGEELCFNSEQEMADGILNFISNVKQEDTIPYMLASNIRDMNSIETLKAQLKMLYGSTVR